MITVELFDHDTLPPKWWLNYVDMTEDRRTISRSINYFLQRDYRAEFFYDNGKRTLVFEDERDYVAMVLKWS